MHHYILHVVVVIFFFQFYVGKCFAPHHYVIYLSYSESGHQLGSSHL